MLIDTSPPGAAIFEPGLDDIEEAQKALEGYKAQLITETEKANSRNVKVILDFLEMWKDRVRKYYMNGLEAYYQDKAEVRTAYNNIHKFPYAYPEYKEAESKYNELIKEFRTACHGVYEKREYTDRRGRTRTEEVKVAEGKYEYLKPYTNERTLEEAAAKLEKDLIREAERKYDFIIDPSLPLR